MIQKNNTIMKNNTKMGTQILKQGDFTLKYFKYCDIYFLFYKDHAIWDCDFNELFDTRLRDYVFERCTNPKKAVEFLNELYKWGSTQQEAFEKILDEVYGKEKQKILDEFHEEKQKILDEFHEEKQKILDEFHEEKIKILGEIYGEKI